MRGFTTFVDELEELYKSQAEGPSECDSDLLNLDEALDGAASERLRKLVDSVTLKSESAFFTGSGIANRLAMQIETELNRSGGPPVIDPACGAGDLLIAAARNLPLGDTLKETLQQWSHRLKGFDRSRTFIKSTKYRLALLAVHRHEQVQRSLPDPLDYFHNIEQVNDALSEDSWPYFDYVLLNPPFSKIEAPGDIEWASGKVSQASLFVSKSLDSLDSDGGILAILPDVLRSGSRYRAWRKHVEASSVLRKLEVIGKFDKLTDIDVFAVDLRIDPSDAAQPEAWWPEEDSNLDRVGDLFDLQVGSVVPHRHSETSSAEPFVDATSLPSWETTRVEETPRRGFDCSAVSPPFVTIRRTSSPTDPKRAVGTVVVGDQDVMVENHLIVLVPKDGSVNRCRELMRRLEQDKTDNWLNTRIRCRHLTITSLEKLPWWNL